MKVHEPLSNQPSYVKPNYSSGDKAAAVFGNKWGMQNKQDQANFENNLNMINYANEMNRENINYVNDLNKQNMLEAPSLKVQGLQNAGINPLAVGGAVAGASLTSGGMPGVGNSSPNGQVGDNGNVFDLLDRYVDNLTKVMKAIGMGGEKAAQIAKIAK